MLPKKRLTGTLEDQHWREALGQVIRIRRLTLNLRQDDLAEATHLNRTYISNVELGYQSMTLKVYSSIAKALNIKLSTLARDAEKRIFENSSLSDHAK